MNLSNLLVWWILASPVLPAAPAPPIVDAMAQPTVSQDTAQETPPPGESPEEATRRSRGWNDGRRTGRSYGANLGYNSLRVFSMPNLTPFLAGGGLTAGAILLDDETVGFFDEHPWGTAFGKVGAIAGGPVEVGALAVALFSASRIASGDRFRSASYDASQAILIATGYTWALKAATHRQRPGRSSSSYQSFPSGHASAAFSWATVFGKHYGSLKVEIPVYTLASLIAISRLAHRSHYLSDVVAGATLGHLAGLAVVRGNNRPASGVPAQPVVTSVPKPTVQVIPSFGPDGGAGLAIAVSF